MKGRFLQIYHENFVLRLEHKRKWHMVHLRNVSYLVVYLECLGFKAHLLSREIASAVFVS